MNIHPPVIVRSSSTYVLVCACRVQIFTEVLFEIKPVTLLNDMRLFVLNDDVFGHLIKRSLEPM